MIIHDNPMIHIPTPAEQKRKQELKEAKMVLLIKIIFALFMLIILVIGCHLDATYTTKGEVFSINGNTVEFVETETGYVFSAYAKETNSLKIGDGYILKFEDAKTGKREDDALINYWRNRKNK